MKSLLKKLSSAVLALAVIASLTPVTGSVILADEAETEVPTTVSEAEPEKKDSEKKDEDKDSGKKDTDKSDADKPKEPEKAKETPKEEPEETEKAEPEAPKETGKAEADEPEETEQAETEAPKSDEDVPEETEAPKETEADVPEETDKAEPEAPKETENAEEPKETEAEQPEETETEAPKETEKADTDVPEETAPEEKPEDKVSVARKNGEVGIISAIIDGNKYLKWNKFAGAVDYKVMINGLFIVYDYDVDGCVVDLQTAIWNMVEAGEIEKTGPYKISLFGYDENDVLVGKWTKDDFSFNHSAKTPVQTELTASVEKGVLTWLQVTGADYYCVFINGVRFVVEDEDRSFALDEQIDWMIKARAVEKDSSYNVRVYAYRAGDDKDVVIAKWSTTHLYDSSADPVTKGEITGITVKNGVMKWNPVAGAETYFIEVEDSGLGTDEEKCSTDLNQLIADAYEDKVITKKSTYKINITALEYSPVDGESVVLAETAYTYNFKQASNPLKVSGKKRKVSYKKLKKKKQTLDVTKVIKGIETGRGNLTFKKTSGNKKIKINKKTGKITIKKGLRKGTYKIKVKVKASGNYGYKKSKTKKVTFKIKVK